MVAGLVDAAGLAAFTRGDQVGLVAITAAVSSAYPVIPLVGGLLLFRERLMRWQAGGAVLILAGSSCSASAPEAADPAVGT